MSGDRLTNNELAWLFAQEAKSAAHRLRTGVGMPPDTGIPPPPENEGTGGVEGALNRLDEAVSALASLHGHPVPRGRRGKIDVAALLWELAPDAKVQIEMGNGTAVFGDEAELRRMLQVLIVQSGGPEAGAAAADLFVRRIGDEVRVGATLGPDTSAISETERAWLSRMAIRYGGRLDLEGGMQVLTLPADVDMQQRELESLKKELAAAQAQGEAYARELAAIFSRNEPQAVPPSIARPSQRAPGDDTLAVLVALARSMGSELRGIFSAIGRDIAPLRGRSDDAGEVAGSVHRHVTAASEVLSDLARLGGCPIGELPRLVDVADLLRGLVREENARMGRHDVRVTLHGAENALDVVPAGALSVLLHALLTHAIDATPPGGEVAIDISAPPPATDHDDEGDAVERGPARGDQNDIVIVVRDGGPPLAPGALAGVLSREFESLAPGRRAGVGLVAAHAIAAHLQMFLSVTRPEPGPEGAAGTGTQAAGPGRSAVRLRIPRTS